MKRSNIPNIQNQNLFQEHVIWLASSIQWKDFDQIIFISSKMITSQMTLLLKGQLVQTRKLGNSTDLSLRPLKLRYTFLLFDNGILDGISNALAPQSNRPENLWVGGCSARTANAHDCIRVIFPLLAFDSLLIHSLTNKPINKPRHVRSLQLTKSQSVVFVLNVICIFVWCVYTIVQFTLLEFSRKIATYSHFINVQGILIRVVIGELPPTVRRGFSR